jgi:hypothetical protein
MKALVLALRVLTLLATIAVASPHSEPDGNDGQSRHHGCLNDHEAANLVDRWRSLFLHFDEAVSNKTLTEDFQLISDSTNWSSPGGPVG